LAGNVLTGQCGFIATSLLEVLVMKPNVSTAPLALLLASLLTWLPVADLRAGNPSMGKMIPQGTVALNGTRLTLETTLYAGDTVSTEGDGVALLLLPHGDQLHLAPASEVQVHASKGKWVARLARGAVLARSGNSQAVSLEARGLSIMPAGAVRYEVVLAENTVLLATQDGVVTVRGGNQTFTVAAGQAMRFERAATRPASRGPNANALTDTAAVWIAVAAAAGTVFGGWLIAIATRAPECSPTLSPTFPCRP
jgi:hypothetical protein